jgi:hypothetical protein
VNVWATVFLGVIALATLTTTVIQISVFIAAGRVARRLERVIEKFEQEVQPAFVHINAISRDAARAMALATAQVERADRLFADLAQRVEETVATFQDNIAGPARQGKAFISALKAAFDVIREARRHARARPRADDDDALFI